MAVLSAELREQAEALKARYPDARSAMLPLLYLAQSAEGYVSREGLREVAELLGLTTAEVEAVASFYTMVRLRPTGKYLLAVCTNVSCALRGGKRLYERAREILGPGAEGVSADGMVTLHEDECLGACELAPMVQVNFLNYANVTEGALAGLIDALRRDDPPPSAQGPKPPHFSATCRMLAGLGGGS